MKKSFQNIVLVGFMGVGKTTLGKLLATETGLVFLDTDRLIEKKENASVSEIFEKRGEPYFRRIEKEVIKEISQKKGEFIIATGGGALLDPENEKNLKQRGVLICLRASPEEILKRIRKEEMRPLLKSGLRLETIKNLLRQRAKRYRNADATVETDHMTPNEILIEIRERLNLIPKIENVSIPVSLGGGRGYPILIGSGNLNQIGEHLSEKFNNKIAVITNPFVWKFHGAILNKSLVQAGFKPQIIMVPDGERYKNLKWVNFVIKELLKNRHERNTPILAFGGGVIGDLAGFVSGIYLRGTPFIQVPTTLIAQVDSSIGGKTGVNDSLGKNLIGLFHHPRFVWIDTSLLHTLKERDYVSGLAEVVKYGMIADAHFFEYLETNRDKILNHHPQELFHIIRRSCQIKADVVSQDEKETGLRKILNYGHTLGHAIEAVTEFKKYRHGEAIAIGMHFAAQLASRRMKCSRSLIERQKILLESLKLPIKMSGLKVNPLIKSMSLDKKVEDGKIFFILPSKIGEVSIISVKNEMIREEMSNFIRNT
ncbi:MAG: 3-dehydroquinate synthase [Nitrospiria bacterium]